MLTPASTPKSAPTRNSVPPPPPPPPPPPKEPDVELYKAKFAFEGQEGEISLKKDDIVELVEKDDNGWWLVKKDGQEGWAPNNYLEIVPPKTKAAPAARPPPPRPPPSPAPAVASTASTSALTPKPIIPAISVKSVLADTSAKPVAVFPGLAPSNGSAAPWKKAASANGSLNSTPASSRPSSSLATKPPPPVATKPKPSPPPVASKPSGGKLPAKPPIPAAPRPGVGAPPPKISTVPKPSAPTGQLDLAAVLAKRAQKIADE